jgi:rod shape-determining protein MreC
MEMLLNRYRNLSVLLVVLVAQLLLLAYQVRSNEDVPLIRVWAVTGVMPLARVLEGVRSGTVGFFRNYGTLLSAQEENHRLKKELDTAKMENQFLKNELATADRVRALAAFQTRSPSKTVAARVIGNGTGVNSVDVFLDRGRSSGVTKGAAVVTPDGIVGTVIRVFPANSQVRLILDPQFRAGVISQKGRVHGILKGQGHAIVMIDTVQNEDSVEPGEWFYTSGDDRVFPKGLPVGKVRSSRPGRVFREITLEPSGLQHGLEEVLVVVEGVHQELPEVADVPQELHLLPPPPAEPTAPADTRSGPSTEADELLEQYRKNGESQGIRYGDNPALAPPPQPDPPVAPPKTSPPKPS